METTERKRVFIGSIVVFLLLLLLPCIVYVVVMSVVENSYFTELRGSNQFLYNYSSSSSNHSLKFHIYVTLTNIRTPFVPPWSCTFQQQICWHLKDPNHRSERKKTNIYKAKLIASQFCNIRVYYARCRTQFLTPCPRETSQFIVDLCLFTPARNSYATTQPIV